MYLPFLKLDNAQSDQIEKYSDNEDDEADENILSPYPSATVHEDPGENHSTEEKLNWRHYLREN